MGGLHCRIVDPHLQGCQPLIRELAPCDPSCVDMADFQEPLSILAGEGRECCRSSEFANLNNYLLQGSQNQSVNARSSFAKKRMDGRCQARLMCLRVPLRFWRNVTLHVERTHAGNQNRTRARHGKTRGWKQQVVTSVVF